MASSAHCCINYLISRSNLKKLLNTWKQVKLFLFWLHMTSTITNSLKKKKTCMQTMWVQTSGMEIGVRGGIRLLTYYISDSIKLNLQGRPLDHSWKHLKNSGAFDHSWTNAARLILADVAFQWLSYGAQLWGDICERIQRSERFWSRYSLMTVSKVVLHQKTVRNMVRTITTVSVICTLVFVPSCDEMNNQCHFLNIFKSDVLAWG